MLARRAWDQEQWTPKRDEAYIGVLVDEFDHARYQRTVPHVYLHVPDTV